MKKKSNLFIVLCLILLMSVGIMTATAYLTDTVSKKSTFTVGEMTKSFEFNAGEGKFEDGSKTNTVVYDKTNKTIKSGELKTPVLEGKTFKVWCKDEALTKPVEDITTLIATEGASITLYASYQDAPAGTTGSGRRNAPARKQEEQPAENEETPVEEEQQEENAEPVENAEPPVEEQQAQEPSGSSNEPQTETQSETQTENTTENAEGQSAPDSAQTPAEQPVESQTNEAAQEPANQENPVEGQE